MKIPRAFISYSHDSQSHKKWVLDFAVRLRSSGIDAILDQWELRPGDDIPIFMERQLASADRVLMVCSDTYIRKANSGAGGVGYEKMILTSEMMGSIESNKIIPIIRQSGTHNVPTFLKTKLFLDFSNDNDVEFIFDDLVRELLGAPLFNKPPIGSNPFRPVLEVPAEKTVDALVELIRVIVEDFESHTQSFIEYQTIVSRSPMSRILLDVAILEAIELGLVEADEYHRLHLTAKGKHFSIQHKLIKRAHG